MSFAGVKVLAERIRESLADHEYTVGINDIASLSGSIGIALYPFSSNRTEMESWEHVSNVADRAAYIAKENGRNAWVSIRGTNLFSTDDFTSVAVDIEALLDQDKLTIDSSIEEPLRLRGGDTDRHVAATR